MEPERPQVGRPHLPLGRGANTLSSSCGLSAGGRCCCICSDCWGGGGGGGPAAAAWETKVACSAACAVGVLTAALERIDSLWCAHPLFHPPLSRSLRCRRARFELCSCQVDPNVKQGSDAPMPPIHVLPCMGGRAGGNGNTYAWHMGILLGTGCPSPCFETQMNCQRAALPTSPLPERRLVRAVRGGGGGRRVAFASQKSRRVGTKRRIRDVFVHVAGGRGS
jgi:hypothetical protein